MGFHLFLADMGINLGRIDRLMAQKFLNQAQIRPVFQQMGGKGMTEFMGMQPQIDPGFLFYGSQYLFKPPDRQTPPVIVEEKLVGF